MKNQRDLRYAIRKLKCGVGPIAVAMVVFGVNSTAFATTMEQPSSDEAAMSLSDKMETDSTLSGELAVKEEMPPTSEIVPVEDPTKTENQELKEAELPKESEKVTLTQEPAEPLPVAEARVGGDEMSEKEAMEKNQALFLQDLYQMVQELRDVNYEQYGATKDSTSSQNLDNTFNPANNKENLDKMSALAGYVDSIVKARGQELEGKKNFGEYILKDRQEAGSKGLEQQAKKVKEHPYVSEDIKKTYISKLSRALSLIDIYQTIPAEFEREVEKQKLEKIKKEAEPLDKELTPSDAPAKPDQEQPQSDIPADQSKVADYKKIYEKIKELAGVNNYYKEAFTKQGQDLSETFAKPEVTDSKLAEKLLSFIGADIIHRSGEIIKPKTIEEAKEYIDQDYKGELDKTVKEEIEKLNKSEASQNLKQKYQALFNKANSLTSAKKEIPEMFMKELAQEQKAEIEKLAEEAKNKIYQMPHLKEKNSYVEQLEKVASKNEIENILKEAAAKNQKGKENFEAANKVNKEIKDFKYLTQEQKNGYSNELEDKTKEEAAKILERAKNENLQGLIQAGQGLIKELQSELTEVDKLPKAPETDDYNEQHSLWRDFSSLGKNQIANFKTYSVKTDLKDFDKIEKFYEDLVDFKSQILIESYTRQVAKYREKYPKNQKILELFNEHLKQSFNNHYGTQTGKDLQHYVDSSATPGFQKIQQLVNNLDKQAEGVQKLEKLLVEYSKKPKTTELVKELERQKYLISILDDTALGFADQHVKYAEDAVATYNKEYQLYLEVLKKGQDDIRAQIVRLRALKGTKATELANKIENKEISYLATAELSGNLGYKTFIPENVAKVKKQVDDFIAEYEKTHRPLTPLEPAIVESKEVEKQEIAYETKEVPANDLEMGKRRVKVVGQKGEKEITYKVRKRDDQVLSRDKVSEKITKEAVTEIIEVGTKEVKPIQPKPHTPEIKTQEKKEVEIPFETKQVENKDLPKGQTRVKQEGKVGIRTIVEEITTKDGKVVSRKTIVDEVTTQPIARIIEVGTKVETPLEIIESTETETKDITYETKEISNPNLPKGERRVTTPGQKGQKTITYKVKKQGDKVISREKISEQITKAPVTEVVEVGTKEVKPAPMPSKPETKTHQEKKEMGTKEPEKMAPEMTQKSQKQVSSGTQKGSSDKTSKKQLPNTGETTSVFAALGTVLLILVMALAIQKKKKSEK